jgi:hypothetical protein
MLARFDDVFIFFDEIRGGFPEAWPVLAKSN